MSEIITKPIANVISKHKTNPGGSSSTSTLVQPTKQNSFKDQSQTSWLLRFFESKHFDMSIAISYLFNTKEPGVQSYLCNRLFTFPSEEVDFYLPQLLNIYIYCCNEINEQLMADMLNAYFRSRCSCRTTGIDFSLKCSWLLDAHINDNAKLATASKESRIKRGLNNAIKLYKLIISEKLRPTLANSKIEYQTKSAADNQTNHNMVKEESLNDINSESEANAKPNNKQTTAATTANNLVRNLSIKSHHHNHFYNLSHHSSFQSNGASNATNSGKPFKPSHNRTRSDTTGITNSLGNNRANSVTSLRVAIGDLMSGRAFDNNCSCFDIQLQQYYLEQQQQQQIQKEENHEFNLGESDEKESSKVNGENKENELDSKSSGYETSTSAGSSSPKPQNVIPLLTITNNLPDINFECVCNAEASA